MAPSISSFRIKSTVNYQNKPDQNKARLEIPARIEEFGFRLWGKVLETKKSSPQYERVNWYQFIRYQPEKGHTAVFFLFLNPQNYSNIPFVTSSGSKSDFDM